MWVRITKIFERNSEFLKRRHQSRQEIIVIPHHNIIRWQLNLDKQTMSARRLILATDDIPTLIQYYNDLPEFQVELNEPNLLAELSRRFGIYSAISTFSDFVAEYNRRRYVQAPQLTFKTYTTAERMAAQGNLPALILYIERSAPDLNWYDQLLIIGLDNQHWPIVEYMMGLGSNIVYHEAIADRAERLRLRHLQDNLTEPKIVNTASNHSVKVWGCQGLPGALLGIIY